MIYINIQNKWLCFFILNKKDLNFFPELLNDKEILEIMNSLNSGFTNSYFDTKTSVIGISPTTNRALWYDTLVHELKHVLSHICEYYNVSESGELAAYLIGYLMKKVISNVKER